MRTRSSEEVQSLADHGLQGDKYAHYIDLFCDRAPLTYLFPPKRYVCIAEAILLIVRRIGVVVSEWTSVYDVKKKCGALKLWRFLVARYGKNRLRLNATLYKRRQQHHHTKYYTFKCCVPILSLQFKTDDLIDSALWRQIIALLIADY